MSFAATARPARRRGKRGRRILQALLALVLALAFLPNLPWVRQSVARRIALKTGLSCEIGRLWLITRDGRPRAEKIRLFTPENPDLQREIALSALSAQLDWRALWHRRIAFSEVTVEGGTIVWQLGGKAPEPGPESLPQPPDPSLAVQPQEPAAPVGLVPLAGPGEAAEPPTVAAQSPSVVPESAVAPSTPAAPEAPPPPTTTPAPTTPTARARPSSLGRFTVRNLRVRLLAPGPKAPELASARLEASVPLAHPSTGFLGLESVVLLGKRPWPYPIDLPLESNGVLLSGAALLDCPGGRLSVSLRSDLSRAGVPLVAEIISEPLALPRLFAWADPHLAPPEGTLQGKVQLAGFVRHPRWFQTSGRIEARQLVLPLGGWLRAGGFEEWQRLLSQPEMRADPGRLVFRSLGGQVVVDDASLMTDDATVRAIGTASPKAGFNLSVRTYLAAGGLERVNRLTETWPAERRLDFTILPNSPWFYLDSWVQGSLDEPEVALWGRSWTFSSLRQELDRLSAQPPPPAG